MSVQTEINRIESAKSAIATAIAGKGVTVPDGTLIDGMAALIESIEAGGGSGNNFPNGTEWTASNTSEYGSVTVYQFHRCNGLTVAATTKGLFYSSDGKTWTQSNVTSAIHGVCARHDIWIAYRDYMYYSIDGKTWTKTSQAFSTSTSNRGSCYGNGTFLVCGLYSTDGQTWTKPSKFTSNTSITCNVYIGGLFLAAGTSSFPGLYYSSDGKTWTQSNVTTSTGAGKTAFEYADGMFVCGFYSKGLYYSSDGKTWTQSNVTSGSYSSVANANGLWVAGSFGSDALLYSTDGVNWTTSNSDITKVNSIKYGSGIWLASTGKGLYYSSDGKTWTQSNIHYGATMANLQAIEQVNGVWIASGRKNETDNISIFHSVTWETS